MLMKKPRHRIFDYPTRFYKPDEDESVKRKRKLGFSRQRKLKSKKRSPIIWLVMIIALVFIIIKLSYLN